MELKDYLRILRAHWVGVVIMVILGLGAATAYNLSQPKVYQATSTGYVSSGDSSDPATASIADTLAKSRVKSYVDIATSTPAAEDVIKSLGLNEPAAALVGQISVEQPIDTVVIKISARAATPLQAQQLADAWVKALAKEVAKVDGVPKPGQPGLRVVPYTSAVLPSTPVLPRTNLNLALGLVVGLLLGFGYAMLRHQFDRRVRSTEDVERTFGAPVIGMIPQSPAMNRDSDVALQLAVTGPTASASSGVAEAFRKLRTNLAYMDVDSPPRVIVVTSPKQSDGKSTVAANLAAAIAVAGQAVTLIDGDLRRPTVARALGVVDDVGLTDVLVGRIGVEEVLQPHPDIPGLSVLASGPIPPNPSELLGSQAMHAVMEQLAQQSIVIVDAPPLLPVTDAAVLTRSADGALVVISHGGTLDSELRTSLNHIATVHGRTLGIIFNRMRKSAAGGYHYGDYTRYEYGADTKKQKSGSGRSSGKSASKSTGKRSAKQPVAKP